MSISLLLMYAVIYILAGAFAGLMSGTFGIGGGIVVVPALLYIFEFSHAVPSDYVMHFAVGSSLAIMLFTSTAAIYAHSKHGSLLWPVYRGLVLGISIGVVLGALTADIIPTDWLKVIFGLFLLFIAGKMFFGFKVKDVHGFPKPWIHQLISFVIGFKSGLLGIGGGALIIPYLTWCGVDTRKIASVSALCTLTVAIIGTIFFLFSGLNKPLPPNHLTLGYLYWPAVILMAIPSMIVAPIGTKLNYVLPVTQLKYIFIVILAITAINMII